MHNLATQVVTRSTQCFSLCTFGIDGFWPLSSWRCLQTLMNEARWSRKLTRGRSGWRLSPSLCSLSALWALVTRDSFLVYIVSTKYCTAFYSVDGPSPCVFSGLIQRSKTWWRKSGWSKQDLMRSGTAWSLDSYLRSEEFSSRPSQTCGLTSLKTDSTSLWDFNKVSSVALVKFLTLKTPKCRTSSRVRKLSSGLLRIVASCIERLTPCQSSMISVCLFGRETAPGSLL